MKNLSNEIKAYALKNALEYGKADAGRILPKLFNHGLDKKDIKKIMPEILKTLKKIPRRYAEAILEITKLLPVNPYFGDIQKMRGEENSWRRRVGAYRIFYKIKDSEKLILVFRIERRTSKTY